jgi:hypothetical protein
MTIPSDACSIHNLMEVLYNGNNIFSYHVIKLDWVLFILLRANLPDINCNFLRLRDHVAR